MCCGYETEHRCQIVGGRRSDQREDDEPIASGDEENPPADGPGSRYAETQRPAEEAGRSAPPAWRAGAASWARRGGNGFLGRRVAERLADLGFAVPGATRHPEQIGGAHV